MLCIPTAWQPRAIAPDAYTEAIRTQTKFQPPQHNKQRAAKPNRGFPHQNRPQLAKNNSHLPTLTLQQTTPCKRRFHNRPQRAKPNRDYRRMSLSRTTANRNLQNRSRLPLQGQSMQGKQTKPNMDPSILSGESVEPLIFSFLSFPARREKSARFQAPLH